MIVMTALRWGWGRVVDWVLPDGVMVAEWHDSLVGEKLELVEDGGIGWDEIWRG